MRALAAALLATLALAGCASTPAPTNGTATTTTTPATPEAKEVLVFSMNRTLQGETVHEVQRFHLAEGHWLCVDWAFRSAGGEVNLTMVASDGSSFPIFTQGSKATGETMIPGVPGDWDVRLNATAWTGDAHLNVSNEA